MDENRFYNADTHRVTVMKPLQGEKLGLTVQQRNECVIVTRILSGSLVDLDGSLQLGDIILEINNIEIHSAEDLSALISLSDKKITFLVQHTKDLKKYGIPDTPSLRKAINEKILPEERILCYVKALFDYDPKMDKLIPCSDAGLEFHYGDILAIMNKDDDNWWQAKVVNVSSSVGLIPSLELEERRKAYVSPEANYTTKIGLCGSLISKKKVKWLFKVTEKSVSLERAELQLYEEVTRLKPFQRKMIVFVGASSVGKRTCKTRLIQSNPSVYASPLPHTSRPKRPEEDNGQRYWFVDTEDMLLGILNHEFLEHGKLNGHYYGIKLESIRNLIDEGKTVVLDVAASTLKVLHFTSEFMPYVIFLAAPGLEEMRHVYENSKISSNLMESSKTLSNFERKSSIRNSSRRAKTLSSLTSLYMEEDVMKNLEESGRLQRAYANYFDVIIVNETHDQTFQQVKEAISALSVTDQWVPSIWVYS